MAGWPPAQVRPAVQAGPRRPDSIGCVARTVLIVDDHPGFRACARELLEAEGFTVVSEAATGASGIAAARELHPEVVLLDVRLPDIDGFEVARRLSGLHEHPEVVLTSSRDAADFASLIESSGARGFVAKDALSGAVLRDLLR